MAELIQPFSPDLTQQVRQGAQNWFGSDGRSFENTEMRVFV
jgi:hypothetical protein